MDINKYFNKKRMVIEKQLALMMPVSRGGNKQVCRAMAYALKGGKRIRPLLCLACSEIISGLRCGRALKPACAVEMVHAYSLVHDDLPCMDNDDFRRGRFAVHKKFGVAVAVLAGDALLTEAFNVLSRALRDKSVNMELVKVLSHAAGVSGMIAGQAADIAPGLKDPAALDYINAHKTGALIAASCKIGAVAAGGSKKDAEALFRFGEYTGLVFQIIDDIIDNEACASLADKRDTFEYAQELTKRSKDIISRFGKRSFRLCQIADFILNRKA
ncbi:MAG: polyprenyl synthetase family protein [Candidatus Omnitrophota bacterium]